MLYKDQPFELKIISAQGACFGEDARGRVALPHGAVYAVRMLNHHPRNRAMASLKVDGKVIGDFVIPPCGHGDLAGPVGSGGLFTFFKRDTQEASDCGQGEISVNDSGLVQVDFSLEVDARNRFERYESSYGGSGVTKGVLRSSSVEVAAPIFEEQSSDGVTGLTGVNRQHLPSTRFREDPQATHVVLSLRLVHDENARPKLDVRPVEPARVGNPIPPRGWDVAG